VNEKPHQLKIKVRAVLKASSLDYTYIVTGPYADAGLGAYLAAMPEGSEAIGTFDVMKKKAVLIGDGKGRISLTTMHE
jgi:hypothetical protein